MMQLCLILYNTSQCCWLILWHYFSQWGSWNPQNCILLVYYCCCCSIIRKDERL